jgi:hypothetical protein
MSESKEFQDTQYICPVCTEKVFKHFHRRDNPYNQTYKYLWFICLNGCDIGCINCRHCNTHGDCNLDFCMNISNWKPEEKFVK